MGVGGYECTLEDELEATLDTLPEVEEGVLELAALDELSPALSVSASAVSSLSCSVNCDSEVGSAGAIFVRVLNDSAASVCNGDVEGTGVNGMNTPGGKAGERMRMYHPREEGRWIVQRTVVVGLCYILKI